MKWGERKPKGDDTRTEESEPFEIACKKWLKEFVTTMETGRMRWTLQNLTCMKVLEVMRLYVVQIENKYGREARDVWMARGSKIA